MKITHLELVEQDGKTELSAQLDDFHLWFRFPREIQVANSIEPFLACGFLAAIAYDREIAISSEYPISSTLYENLEQLQIIYHSWNYDLNIIPVNCSVVPPETPVPGVASLYSAGVDSMYTLLRHQQSITHMIRLFGFDFIESSGDVGRVIAHDQHFADMMGKQYIPVESNFRIYADSRKLSFPAVYAFGLYAVTLALGFERSYFPSSHASGELFPESSHPLTDPLWSNGKTRIVHDVGLRRSEKMQEIVKHPAALANLHVCWRYPIENCGRCSKCLRTLVTLRLLNERSNIFPELSLEALQKLRIRDESGLTFVADNLILAEEKQDWELYRILKKIICRYQLDEMKPKLDEIFLGGRLRRLHRKLRKPDWLDYVSLVPKERKY